MFKLLKNLTKKDIFYCILILILVILQVWLDLQLPDYMKEITKLVQTEGSEILLILKNGAYMLLCALGSLVASVITGYITATFSSNFSMIIRKKLFSKVTSLSLQEINDFSTSSLITRTTNDITQIEMLTSMGLQLLLKAPITAVWAIRKILNKNWQWSLITLIGVIILLSVISVLGLLVLPKFKIVQQLTDKLNNVTRENLLGIKVIKAFNAHEYQENKFAHVNNDLTNMQLFNQKAFAIMQPLMYLVMYGLTLAIYFVGAYLIDQAAMIDKLPLLGDMIVFSSYSMQVIMSILMLAMIFVMLPRTMVSANRINEVLNTNSSIINGTLKSKTDEVGTIEFKNVSFKYPDALEYLLKDISFKVNKGETIAFIGRTGSGKSTLINLVLRFYDVTKGEVLVDGVNVREYDQEYLNKKIGYVSQKAVIFNGTVSSNVAYGDDSSKISDEKIKESLKVAEAKAFVENLDDKYQAKISRDGTNISGGQKQRLSIARAIAKNPEIYIFDDSFSALDYKTDMELRSNLKEYTKDATVLIVAQRIGTIINADKIIVLDNGELVGIGNHEYLLKNCNLYKEIAESQLSKEELNNA